MLQQQQQQKLQPLAYFSRQLKPPEQRYNIFGREHRAMYLAVKRFRHSLEGCKFVIYNDHRPLSFMLRSKPDKYSPNETQHLDFVLQFTSDIRHIPDEQNVATNALSRLPINSLSLLSDIGLQQMALDQPHFDTLDLSSPEYATGKFTYLLWTRRWSATPRQIHHAPSFQRLIVGLFLIPYTVKYTPESGHSEADFG